MPKKQLSVRQTVTRLRAAGYDIVVGSYEVCPHMGVSAAVERPAHWCGPLQKSYYELPKKVDGGHWCSDGFIFTRDD